MLAPKKIETKRLVLYLAIIGVMIGGSIYLIYKNFMPKESKPAEPVNIKGKPIGEIDWDIKRGIFGIIKEEEESFKFQEDIFDFLKSAKFKKLKDNFNKIPPKPSGTSNPFKSFTE